MIDAGAQMTAARSLADEHAAVARGIALAYTLDHPHWTEDELVEAAAQLACDFYGYTDQFARVYAAVFFECAVRRSLR
jgi:hypothetical protein